MIRNACPLMLRLCVSVGTDLQAMGRNSQQHTFAWIKFGGGGEGRRLELDVRTCYSCFFHCVLQCAHLVLSIVICITDLSICRYFVDTHIFYSRAISWNSLVRSVYVDCTAVLVVPIFWIIFPFWWGLLVEMNHPFCELKHCQQLVEQMLHSRTIKK